jgi:Membrane-bound lysozyme-inhibitor of c-type lysozyme
MRKLVAISLAGAFAALAVTGAQAQSYYHYECQDGATFEVAFYRQTKSAFLQFGGKSYQLPKRFSLTSQRFSKDGVSFSMKTGGEATIRRAGKTSVNCKVK